jgi:hypothetical protein
MNQERVQFMPLKVTYLHEPIDLIDLAAPGVGHGVIWQAVPPWHARRKWTARLRQITRM